MTHSRSRRVSDRLYNIERKISVVIIRHEASCEICMSPVMRPTSLKIVLNSRNFWFDRALIGDV